MPTITSFTARPLAGDLTLIGSHLPVPGLGVLPVNAFVIDAREPVLVDTGFAGERESFLAALHDAIDPGHLRWIWITHTDADHVGNLAQVLALAPRARVVTNFLGMAKLGLLQLPTERTMLLNPGQALAVGDRELAALRPPLFDAPETMGLFDRRTRTLYSADCFGTLMERPVQAAEELGTALGHGLATWATVDAPWLTVADRARLAGACTALADWDAARIVGSHAAPAEGALLPQLIEHLLDASRLPTFEGPDQAQLEAMMARAA